MQRNEAQGGFWAVIDKNAREKRRVHDAPSGRRYPLDAVEPTYMPKADALVFLRDAAFEVYDENDALQAPLPASEAAGERKITELAAEECVARYDELTTAALLARVAARPGGASIDTMASREQLIGFLMRAPTKVAASPQETARTVPGQPDDIDTENAAMATMRTTDEILAGI